MEVLVLSPPRTGTSSMAQALRILGYHDIHHMSSCISNPPECDLWLQFIEAKWFGKGTVRTRKQWDVMLGDCMAVTDFPAAAFAEDLIRAYPEAKVVLKIRSVDAWYCSVQKTIGDYRQSWVMNILALSGDPFFSRFNRMSQALCAGFFDFSDTSLWPPKLAGDILKPRYLEHYQHIREMVPNDRLLERDITGGWESLCEFLGKGIPEVPYPRVNDAEEFKKSIGVMVGASMRRLGRIFVQWLSILLMPTALYWLVVSRTTRTSEPLAVQDISPE